MFFHGIINEGGIKSCQVDKKKLIGYYCIVHVDKKNNPNFMLNPCPAEP